MAYNTGKMPLNSVSEPWHRRELAAYAGVALATLVSTAVTVGWIVSLGQPGTIGIDPADLIPGPSEFQASSAAENPAEFIIYADTAISSASVDSQSACDNQLASTLRVAESAYEGVTVRHPKSGVAYLSFTSGKDNFVLRCFNDSENRYRVLLAGSGTSSDEVNTRMSYLFGALNY